MAYAISLILLSLFSLLSSLKSGPVDNPTYSELDATRSGVMIDERMVRQRISGGFTMPIPRIKDRARQLVDALPDDATWEDLEYQIYVRRNLERGLKSLADGEKTLSSKEVLEHFGLSDAP